jgi:hypothetical protein
MIRTRKSIYALLITTSIVVFSIAIIGVASAQSFPPAPSIYSGSVTVAGSPAPDGRQIIVRIRDYASDPATIINGKYQLLIVQPPDGSYDKGTVSFFIDGRIANENDTFVVEGFPRIKRGFDLSFDSLLDPTPTASPIPPPPTATPQVALPSAYAGTIVIAGENVPKDSVLIARVGDYESLPAIIIGNNYSGLVLDPQDLSLVGQPVEFVLNGFPSSTNNNYVSGSSNRAFDLIFVGIPTATATLIPTSTPVPPTETPTPVPPTATPVPPTVTPVPPTATPVPPTATPVPPTATPLSPTATRVPPTATPLPPTATPVPPTATPDIPTITPPILGSTNTPTPIPDPPPSSGCGSSFGQTSFIEGLGGMLMLFGPLLGLLVIRKRLKNRR